MSSIPYGSTSAVLNRITVSSLGASILIGVIFLLLGADSPIFIALILVAILSSVITAVTIKRLLSGVRSEQLRILYHLLSEMEISSVNAETDDLKALQAMNDNISNSYKAQQKEHNELFEQIFLAQGNLKRAMQNWSAGDEKEADRVRDAVTAMELLNNEYSQVINEIEELSGRTDERASISTEMSATTDAIAENINHYSNSVLETSTSIEQMAKAACENAENIRALAISTEKTVESINLISISQNSVRENSERSAAVSENVRIQAQQGLRSMIATMKAMQEIANSNDESYESINRLSCHSARVGEFLRVIQEVVEQTNLLSLNASIIAAQAGTRGRAFAVVAEEVRSLARRTSASTKEIEELVRNIQKETASVQRTVTQGKDKVKQGVKISGMANDALEVIFKSSEDAFKMVSNIVVETTEQAANINRITEEAEKNLERVQQITIATEHQQQGSNVIVKNLEQMRELAHRINNSAQEQARGNRLYLKSVMEDNDRTRELSNEAAHQIVLAEQVVAAIKEVEVQIQINSAESSLIAESLHSLIELIDIYRGEPVVELEEEV